MNDNDLELAYRLLGVESSASTETIRRAYLRLVRENPPEKSADRFRAISDAYRLLQDPLAQANGLLPNEMHGEVSLHEVIEEARKSRPTVPTSLLLSLGNDFHSATDKETGQESSNAATKKQ